MADPPLDIPQQAPHVLATLEQTHVVLEVTPNEDARLAYNLAVPRDWAYSEEFGPVPSGLFKTAGLGFFAGSAEPGAPVIAVTVTPVPFEVPIDAWIRLSLATEGWQIVAAGWFPGPNGLFFDITGQRLVDDQLEVRRTSVRVDGSRIFSVNTFCERKHWDAAKEIFWAAHVTFKLLGGGAQTRMELWAKAEASAPDFELAHPATWSAEPAAADSEEGDGDVSGLHVRLLDAQGKTLLAYLQVKAVRSAAGQLQLAALHEKSLAQLRRGGVVPLPGEQPLSADEDPRALGVEGWLGGFSGRARMGDSEVATRLGYVQRAELSFSFALLSPLMADDPLTALRAQRVFEIARATLRSSDEKAKGD